MRVLVVSNNFPDKKHIQNYVFLKKTTDALINEVVELNIIAPKTFYYKTIEFDSYQNIIQRPIYLSIWAKNKFTRKYLRWLNHNNYVKAIKKAYQRLDNKPTVIYCHFIRPAICVIDALRDQNIPITVGVGESSFHLLESEYSKEEIKQYLSKISHFFALSNTIKKYLIDQYSVESHKILVTPNGVSEKFGKVGKNKEELRLKHNIPIEKFVVIFVGHFVHRKGPDRLLDAVKDNPNIALVLVGSGSMEFVSDVIVFKGNVPNEILPELLSASDLFVLPTISEGSSNAIVEAMACGLPIISSNIDSIKEQVDQRNAILVDPLDVMQIKKAIEKLYIENELRQMMSLASSKRATEFTLERRLIKMMDIFETLMANK